jgi:hypothetical protein
MARQLNYPKTVGVRLSEQDGAKLQALCTVTHRPPGDVLRLLVRLAQPSDVLQVRFVSIGSNDE